MSAEPWIEDENHQTINGERWVARECKTGTCHSEVMPDCEFLKERSCGKITLQGCCVGRFRRDGHSVRWYRLGSPALAFFDKPKKDDKALKMEKEAREFKKIVMPVMDWLKTNHSPHHKIIIDSESAELVSGEISHVRAQ